MTEQDAAGRVAAHLRTRITSGEWHATIHTGAEPESELTASAPPVSPRS